MNFETLWAQVAAKHKDINRPGKAIKFSSGESLKRLLKQFYDKGFDAGNERAQVNASTGHDIFGSIFGKGNK